MVVDLAVGVRVGGYLGQVGPGGTVGAALDGEPGVVRLVAHFPLQIYHLGTRDRAKTEPLHGEGTVDG